MAWTAPQTYVVGTLVNASDLNTYLRDNLLALSTHQHTGAAGDGSESLEGIDELEFDHITPDSAPGAGLTKLYYNSTAGALVMRIGTGADLEIRLDGHTH